MITPTGKPKNKTGGVITIIGRQGSGKTPIIKELIKASKYKNVVVRDVRREYDSAYTLFHKGSNFKQAFPQFENCFIVVEEATGFLNSFKDMDMEEQLIAVEHKRNTLVFAFHSLMDAPPYILRLSKFIILLDTNDDPDVIFKSRKAFYKYLTKPKPFYINNYKKI